MYSIFFNFSKTKFPKACTVIDAISHHYNNYIRQFSKNNRIWPLFFSDKCNFYLKLIYMRTICKQIYVSSSIQQICMQMIPLKGYHLYDLRLLHFKNILPESKEQANTWFAYLPYYNKNN